MIPIVVPEGIAQGDRPRCSPQGIAAQAERGGRDFFVAGSPAATVVTDVFPGGGAQRGPKHVSGKGGERLVYSWITAANSGQNGDHDARATTGVDTGIDTNRHHDARETHGGNYHSGSK